VVESHRPHRVRGLRDASGLLRPSFWLAAGPGAISEALQSRLPTVKSPVSARATNVEAVDIASLDELTAKVAKRRLVTITLSDLLLLAGRKRPTTSALSQLTQMLDERSLATLPALPTVQREIRVFRRDSSVAALITQAFTVPE
jgi:hypothetical protein